MAGVGLDEPGVQVRQWYTDVRGRRRPIVERAPVVEVGVPPTPNVLGRQRVRVAETQQADLFTRDVPLDAIWPDPTQHRRLFDQGKLRELADSIEQVGLLEPIVIRSKPGPEGEAYQIIAGERRWRACQMLGLDSITAYIRDDLTDAESRRLQIIENLQREEVTDVEEATAYAQLRDQFREARAADAGAKKLSDEELEEEARRWVADQVSKSPKRVGYYLKLADMPPEVKDQVEGGRLTVGHATALARLLEGDLEPEELERRQADLVNLARMAAADAIGKRALDKMISEYLAREGQVRLFEEGEAPGPTIGRAASSPEARLAAKEQKSRLKELFDAMVEILGKTWDERKQEFRTDVFTANELEVILGRINGCMSSLQGLGDAVEGEIRYREMQAALLGKEAGGAETMGVRIAKASIGDNGHFQMFVPFTKVDPVAREVTGVATSEAWDNQNEQMAWPGIVKAVNDYSEWRNIRAMHQPRAVGTAPVIRLNLPLRQVILVAKIVDRAEWEKVEAGVYRGYSIGGKKRAVETAFNPNLGKDGTRILQFDWLETSLVDRPANPDARFLLVKRASGAVIVTETVIGGAD